MNKKKRFAALVASVLLLTGSACAVKPAAGDNTAPPSQAAGQIYLYGEQHGVEKIYAMEAALWAEHYQTENMRHLFIELSYYTAEYLNLWMKSDNDDILEQLYSDWFGTALYNPYIKDFFSRIKSECPETIFHGTDVGHQYNSTGERFLKQLESSGMEGSEPYILTQEAIEQGKTFYGQEDNGYRENKMAENFIREYDKISGEKVMGIYGSAHTGLDAMDFTGSVPCMANQLKARYGDAVLSEDLSWIAKDIEPLRTDTIKVGEKDYEASYFGKQDLTGFKDYACREFWRLENAYDDFKDNPKNGNVLPYNNYPMLIETGQVFVIDHTKTDGSVARSYYRADGNDWNGMPSTEEFTP